MIKKIYLHSIDTKKRGNNFLKSLQSTVNNDLNTIFGTSVSDSVH